MPIFRVKSVKIYTGRGARDKYQVCFWAQNWPKNLIFYASPVKPTQRKTGFFNPFLTNIIRHLQNIQNVVVISTYRAYIFSCESCVLSREFHVRFIPILGSACAANREYNTARKVIIRSGSEPAMC